MKADFNEMLRHLQLVFAGSEQGMVEIAYGCPAPNKATLTDTHGLEQLAGEALQQNGRGYNTYVGACVRHPHTAPFGRASDRDVICAPAIVVDLDEQGRAENAPKLWDDTPPSFCVVTGLHPHKRMQMWWLFNQPMLSLEIWSCLQRAMAAKYDGDTTVTNPSRVMRLAGSIAQPVKEGRVLEPTFLENVRDPLPRYSVGQITEHCEQFLGEPTNGAAAHTPPPQHTTPTNSLGLSNGAKLTDERERYMRDTVLACLREFIGTHGAAPGAQELFDAVWPQYEEHVAIEVPGKQTRGSDEVFAKCVSTLQRFHRGEISSMRDLDAAVASHQARHPAHEAVASPPLQPQPGSKLPLMLSEWLGRDLLPPDFLLGNLMSTTTRSLLIAPTGQGKTMFALALGFAVAAGADFLHWRGRGKPARVLYIDGEMSNRLLKQRLQDACERFGAAPGGLFALSHEDVPNFAPLNTPAGQTCIEAVIEWLGGVDFVIFDSVMCLTVGDMKEEESWSQTLPWVRKLTGRAIGQLWVHHTGHDETHGYGTKTREWQLDLVMLMQPEKRDGIDVSFALTFSKARERAPANRADFQDAKIALVCGRWESEAAERMRPQRASPLAAKFLDSLYSAVLGDKARTMPNGCRAAHTEDWRSEAVARGLIDTGVKAHSARTLFARYRRELVAANLVACEGEWTWVLHHNERSETTWTAPS